MCRRLFGTAVIGAALAASASPGRASAWAQYAPSRFFLGARTIRVAGSVYLDQGGRWYGLKPRFNSAQAPQAAAGSLLSPDLQTRTQARAEEAAARAIRYAPRPGTAPGSPPRLLREAESRTPRLEAEYLDDCTLGVQIWVRDASRDFPIEPPRGLAVAVLVDQVTYWRGTVLTAPHTSEPRVTVDTIRRTDADEHVLRRLEDAVARALDRTFTDLY